MSGPDPNGCSRCGRAECPALTVPFVVRPDESRNPALHSARTEAAYADCKAHALDWRALYFAEQARADAAESALARATVASGEGQPEDRASGRHGR